MRFREEKREKKSHSFNNDDDDDDNRVSFTARFNLLKSQKRHTENMYLIYVYNMQWFFFLYFFNKCGLFKGNSNNKHISNQRLAEQKRNKL